MSEVSIIGGITADIEGHPYNRLIHGDSNPGKITISYGGVGRNIVENLARLGNKVNFVSVAGDDLPGRGAVRELQDLGVDVEHVRLLPEENTAVYMSILNLVGDMELAMCNMDVLERISAPLIEQALGQIKKSNVVGLDTNLTEDTLEYVTRQLENTPIFLDPVSAAKAERARKVIGRFYAVKPNRMEAEAISGLSILSEQDLKDAAHWFMDQGVRQVFITLGGGGIFYMDEKEEGFLRPDPMEIVSVTGAGDAFSAAVIHGMLKGYGIHKTAKLGMAAAEVAMQAKSAVNNQISMDKLRQKLDYDPL